jgi:hypothetical protein
VLEAINSSDSLRAKPEWIEAEIRQVVDARYAPKKRFTP